MDKVETRSIIPFQRAIDADKVIEDREKAFQISLRSLVTKTTPKDAIYKREGRGKQKFDYIQGWWVIDQLNALFDYNWDWELEDQFVGPNQVWVRGKLTVKRLFDDGQILTISKSSFGGAEIKVYGHDNPKSGKSIDIGDDLKAASTDAFKKAASLLGIAGDIYGKDDSTNSVGGLNDALYKALILRGNNIGMDEEEVKEWTIKELGVNSFDEVKDSSVTSLLPTLIGLATEN